MSSLIGGQGDLSLSSRTGLSLDMKLNTVISCVPFFANWIFSVIFRQETGRDL